MRKGPRPTLAVVRLARRTEFSAAGCWLWLGGTDRRGYGRISSDYGKQVYTHRLAYEHLVAPIPAGMVIDHLCRVPACWNPDHLEPVSQQENLLRGKTVNAINAAKGCCDRGHELDEENTYLNAGKRHCRACRAILARERRRREQKVAA